MRGSVPEEGFPHEEGNKQCVGDAILEMEMLPFLIDVAQKKYIFIRNIFRVEKSTQFLILDVELQNPLSLCLRR